MLQLGGTRVHGLPQAWKARPQLLELFERVMRSERPLVPWRNPAAGGGGGGGGGDGGGSSDGAGGSGDSGHSGGGGESDCINRPMFKLGGW